MLERDPAKDCNSGRARCSMSPVGRLSYVDIDLTDGGKIGLASIKLRSLFTFPTVHPLGFSISNPLGPRAAIFINQIDSLTQQADACLAQHGWSKARKVGDLDWLHFRTE